MSDRQPAPDLLDELLGLEEPVSAEEAQFEEEPLPRRRWWRRKHRAAAPEAFEAEPEQEVEPQIATPAAEEDRVEDEKAGEDPPLEDFPDESRHPRNRWWRGRRQSLLPEGFETDPESSAEPAEPVVAAELEKREEPSPHPEKPGPENGAEGPEEHGSEPASDEIEESPARRRRRLRQLREAVDEPRADDSANGSSDLSSLGSGDPIPPPGHTAGARRPSRYLLFVVAGGALLAISAVATLLDLSFRSDPQPWSSGAAAPADPLADPVQTLLLYGSYEKPASEAVWMTLLSVNSETQEGSVVYVPAHTAAEIPGRGLLGIGESLRSGPSLLEVSTETLLGVPVDARLELTPEQARALLRGIGDVSVDVPFELRVPAGEEGARILIPQGPQQLAPDQLVSLLYRPGIDGDDAELGGRHLAFWNGVLSKYAHDPEVLASAIADAEPPLSSPAATERIGGLLSDLAQLPASSRTLANLPVKEVSVGGDELYETDSEELSAFVGETVGETDLAADLSRVQVLNGNGVPGIGVDVAEKLVGNGYQISLSGNADRLDYYWTRIVSYDSSPEGVAAARRARALLGTGRVQVSSQGQGIVDLTIVVGRDFLRTR